MKLWKRRLKSWIRLAVFLVCGFAIYVLLAKSEVNRLTAMCNSISVGVAAPEVLARLSEAGGFKIAGATTGDERREWFFYPDRYPVFPSSSCHIQQANNVITSVHIFRD